MLNWVSTLTKYLNKFLELRNFIASSFSNSRNSFWAKCSFFWSQVTKNLINLLNALR